MNIRRCVFTLIPVIVLSCLTSARPHTANDSLTEQFIDLISSVEPKTEHGTSQKAAALTLFQRLMDRHDPKLSQTLFTIFVAINDVVEPRGFDKAFFHFFTPRTTIEKKLLNTLDESRTLLTTECNSEHLADAEALLVILYELLTPRLSFPWQRIGQYTAVGFFAFIALYALYKTHKAALIGKKTADRIKNLNDPSTNAGKALKHIGRLFSQLDQTEPDMPAGRVVQTLDKALTQLNRPLPEGNLPADASLLQRLVHAAIPAMRGDRQALNAVTIRIRAVLEEARRKAGFIGARTIGPGGQWPEDQDLMEFLRTLTQQQLAVEAQQAHAH